MSVSFLRLKDVPRGPKDLVCRGSMRTAIVATTGFVIVALGFALVAYAYSGQTTPANGGSRHWFYLVLAAALLLTAWQVRRLIAAMKASNWLLQARPDGLYVKYRNLLNHRYPEDDDAVLFIPRRHIAWVREKNVESDMQSDDGRFLDIRLRNTPLMEFQERLKFERHRLMDAAKDKALQHLPIRVIEPNVVRINWADAQSQIKPMLTDTLGRLRAMAYAIAPMRGDKGDRDPSTADEDHILDLVDCGDETGAIQAAQQCYQVDASEARIFIERLRA